MSIRLKLQSQKASSPAAPLTSTLSGYGLSHTRRTTPAPRTATQYSEADQMLLKLGPWISAFEASRR